MAILEVGGKVCIGFEGERHLTSGLPLDLGLCDGQGNRGTPAARRAVASVWTEFPPVLPTSRFLRRDGGRSMTESNQT